MFFFWTLMMLLLHVPAREEAARVEFYLTTPDQRHLLERQPDLAPDANPPPGALTIDLDPAKTYQRMEGFGAAMTESSAWLIRTRLPASERDRLMRKLFDPQEGIGLSYLRMPMGASDFALRSYTYDDLPPGQSDLPLAHFSIAHDRETILPALQQARALNPALKIMATPWSPPAWMKTSGELNSGKLRPECYDAYADYFVKFIAAYTAAGVPIDTVSPQNEPHHEPAGYPCMRMDADEQAAFVRDHLGPRLARAGLKTRILIWDHNWDEPDYPLTILNDAKARQYVAGTAFHAYAGTSDAQSKVHDAYPDKDIYFTECSGGDWSPDFGSNLKWNAHTLLIGAVRHWAKTVLLWNLALDDRFGPQNGGCNNCRGVVTITPATGKIDYNVEYYVLGHAARFVRPGAVRIASNTLPQQGIEDVAFRNPDGSLVVIVLNAGERAQTVTIRAQGNAFTGTLPAGALATFRWR